MENSWNNPAYQLLAKLLGKLPKISLHLLEFQNLRVYGFKFAGSYIPKVLLYCTLYKESHG